MKLNFLKKYLENNIKCLSDYSSCQWRKINLNFWKQIFFVVRNTSVGCLLSSPNRPLDRILNFIFENFRLLLFSHASKHVSCFDEILVFIFRRIGQQSVCWMTRLPPLFGYQRAGNSLIRDISARFFLVVFFLAVQRAVWERRRHLHSALCTSDDICILTSQWQANRIPMLLPLSWFIYWLFI